MRLSPSTRKVLNGCGLFLAFVSSLASAQQDSGTQWKAEVARLVSGLDQRAVLFDGEGRGFQFSVVGDEIHLFAAGTRGDPVGTTVFDRPITGLNSAASSPGLRYLPSAGNTMLAWFYEDGKTILLSFELRAGRHLSKTVAIEGYIYPTAYSDGSIGGFSGGPWKMQFDVAKVTDAGLVPASGNIMTPPGAPVYVIGNAEASHGDSIIRTTAFANWSDGDTKYITQLSSDGLSRVFRHSDAYAPLELLPNNELMMLDASECLLKSPAETTDAESRSEQICSSNIVAVALPGKGGAIDTAAKRTIRRFAAPDLLLATTNPASLSDKSSISLIGDLVFTVSRNAKGPHLDWVSITDPARGGRLDLETSAGDNISILHRDDFSGHLQLAVDGFLSPLKFVSIAIGKGGNSDPYVGDIVKVRPPTFAAEKFSVSPIGSEAGGVSALLVSQAPSPHGRTCRGRALIEVYGGYGVTTHLDYLTSYGPYWLERGNSYIAALVRGGGDMGEQGYRQGINGHFTASVDDLIAIAKEARKRGCSDVTVKGASHGGNLAALAALKAPDSIDRAIIDESPLDLARGLTAGSFDASIYPTFQDEAAKTAFMRQASPLSVVEQFKSKRQPSFLLLYGGRDEIAPSYHGEAFAKAARQKGIEVELIIDPNLAHGPPTSVDGYAEQMSHILSFANRGR